MFIKLLITVHLIQQRHPLIKASGIINAWSAFSSLRSKVLRALMHQQFSNHAAQRGELVSHISKQTSDPKHPPLEAPSSFCNSLPSSTSLLSLLSVFQEFSRSAGQKAFGGTEKKRKARERKRTAGFPAVERNSNNSSLITQRSRGGLDSFTSVYIGTNEVFSLEKQTNEKQILTSSLVT